MAWTEKYVDLADGGAGDGSSGDPWASFAEAVSEIGVIGAPTKVYVRGNGTLTGALAFSNDGTTAFPLVWVGCTGSGATWTPIGDDAGATKPTLSCSTNQVTVTGDYQQFENIVFTGAVTTSGGLVSNTTAGLWITFIRCRFTNTASNTSARALSLAGTASVAYACFFDCVATGTAPTTAVNMSGANCGLIGCHVRGGESNVSLGNSAVIAFNILEACDGASAITGDTTGAYLINNTITGSGADGIRQTAAAGWFVINNLVHSATSIAINNSSADNFGLRCFNNMFYNCGTNAVDGTPENMAWVSTTAGADPLPNLTEPANNANDFDLAVAAQRLAFPGAFEAGAYAFVGRISHGAVQPLPDFPSAGNVQNDDTVDGVTGTLTVPAVTDVKSGVAYGAGGTEFTGTLAAGGGGGARIIGG